MGWVWVFLGYFSEWGRHFGGIWDVGGWELEAGMEEEKWGGLVGEGAGEPVFIGLERKGEPDSG
jgi:hypothetical protein